MRSAQWHHIPKRLSHADLLADEFFDVVVVKLHLDSHYDILLQIAGEVVLQVGAAVVLVDFHPCGGIFEIPRKGKTWKIARFGH